MNLNRLNKILLILIALSLAPACRGSDGGGNNGNGGGAMMYDYKCPNGTPGDGLAPTPNTTKCTACNEGYSLENMSCTILVGMGTKASPFILMNYAHLKAMGNALNKHYKLDATIDARDSWSEGDMGCTAYAGDATLPTGTPCTGWMPVGVATRFTGSLDGNGHSITNLYVYVSTSGNAFGGLFGVAGNSAEIKNLGLTNIYINASSSSKSFGGGLVGTSSGTIINSYTTGSVTVSNSGNTSASHGGGLVGASSGTISNSYTTGSVTVSNSGNTSDSYGGGLVGSNHAGAIINSYATGSVTVSNSGNPSASYGGALVGDNNVGAIINSYATGSVTVSNSGNNPASYGGGLVGNSLGTISNSYATGSVTIFASSSSRGGGLAGNNFGAISNSYATGRVTVSASGTSAISSGGGLVGRTGGTISNSYATGEVGCGGTCATPRFAGLAGANLDILGGVIRGTNYFVYNGAGAEDDNGVHTGSCAGTCTQATGMTAALRLTWMRDTLNEATAFTTDTENTPAQFTAWDTAAWANLNMNGFPKLKYAEMAAFCSDSSYTTQTACTAPRGTWESGSCSDTSLTTEAACTAPHGTWRAVGTECEVITPSSDNTAANNGTPTPDCGDLIAGQ